VDALADCGYVAPAAPPFDRSFYVAAADEWKARYVGWIRDPMFLDQLYRSRPLFDLCAIHGDRSIWDDVAATVDRAVDREFFHILANDCLMNLPPLSFFQDAVVEDSGDLASVFRLEESVLGPLVDVGRVFGFATGAGLGRSTLERLARARMRFPEHEAIFRDAAEALAVVLWQQGRVGISARTGGAELPPALLSRQDRHLLKATFRPILRLIEFTADRSWISAL
jgi:signal-transduction protein with cAMP-binding, CBS, and nucleotidyltransferase domain